MPLQISCVSPQQRSAEHAGAPSQWQRKHDQQQVQCEHEQPQQQQHRPQHQPPPPLQHQHHQDQRKMVTGSTKTKVEEMASLFRQEQMGDRGIKSFGRQGKTLEIHIKDMLDAVTKSVAELDASVLPRTGLSILANFFF